MAFKIKGNNIEITRGDTGIIEFTPDNYQLKNGDVVYFSVKENVEDEYYAIQKEIKNFIGNKAVIVINPEDTSDLDYSTYFYDIQLALSDGTINTVIEKSKFKIKEEIT